LKKITGIFISDPIQYGDTNAKASGPLYPRGGRGGSPKERIMMPSGKERLQRALYALLKHNKEARRLKSSKEPEHSTGQKLTTPRKKGE
jgi:hypothetical protein